MPPPGAAVAGVDGLAHPRRSSPSSSASSWPRIILWLTGHFTGTDKRPDPRRRPHLAAPAPPPSILSGIGVGLESAVYTAVIIGGAVYLAFLLGGGSVALALFLVALAGCGLLTTVGVIVAMDTFGPVSDNAQGIAEMSGDVDDEGAQILTELDAVGNTTKAITKGIAIATAVLAATALFGSLHRRVADPGPDDRSTTDEITEAPEQVRAASMFDLQIVTPSTLVGLLLGAAVVFLFSGLAINAVTRAAGAIVFEVRRQFREHPGIMDYTEKPEYGRVVDICTRDSLRELATPGLLAALTPVAVGFGLGIGAAGRLPGRRHRHRVRSWPCSWPTPVASWDNAKKIVEDGAHGGKGSAAHEATVIGDTVGDPFKDTAGPAINPLLKVMNLVSVLIAPAIVILTVGDGASPADPLRHRGRRADHHRGRGGRLQSRATSRSAATTTTSTRSRSTTTSSRRVPRPTSTSRVRTRPRPPELAPRRTRSSPGSDADRTERRAHPTPGGPCVVSTGIR